LCGTGLRVKRGRWEGISMMTKGSLLFVGLLLQLVVLLQAEAAVHVSSAHNYKCENEKIQLEDKTIPLLSLYCTDKRQLVKNMNKFGKFDIFTLIKQAYEHVQYLGIPFIRRGLQ
jgi:hypothetical protein